jgi:hypothetical protein
MKRVFRLFAFLALLSAVVMPISFVQANNGPHPWPIISSPINMEEGYPGVELGYGDVLAQCQTYNNTNNSNPYAPFVTSVDLISGDNINTGAGVNQGCRTPQNETAIAVNPSNPNNLVAGSNDYRDCCVSSGGTLRNDADGWVYTSLDGGRTWQNIKLPGVGISGDPNGVFKKITSVGDPAIAFGKNNTVYYANIAFNRVDDSNGIVVNVSHDGGLTWDKPTLIAFTGTGNIVFFNDKVYVGADPNSGAAYISWTRFRANPKVGYISSPIVAVATADYGATWSDWVDVSGPYLYNQGSIPVVAPDGTVYISFDGSVASDNFADYNIVAKSTDHGKTFTQTVVSRNYDETYPVDPVLGRQELTGLRFRINSFPALTVDPVTGVLYMSWADNRFGTSSLTSSQVFVQHSTDGVNWSAVQRLTSTAEDKIYPWVGAYGGNVMVSYYTREFAGSASKELDFAYVKSNDGGATWTGSAKLTEQSSDPSNQFTLGAFIGDYTGVAVGADLVAHPLWTDFRGNPGVTSPNQDAVTTRVNLAP